MKLYNNKNKANIANGQVIRLTPANEEYLKHLRTFLGLN